MKALVVLGGGVNKDGHMPAWIHARLNKAIEEWRTGKYSLVVVTGKGRADYTETEAMSMKKALADKGVPESLIETENESTSTIENAYFCRINHIEPQNIKEITIVTNQFHIKRAESIFKFVFGDDFTIDISPSDDTGIDHEAHGVLEQADIEQASFLQEEIFKYFDPGNLEQIKKFIFDRDNEYAIKWANYKANSELYKKITELMT